MELLERDSCLGALDEYAADAEAGRGRLVLVTGEAGIGKTAVVDAFRAAHPDLTWLWGACDGGFTPRPLGPLHEMATSVGGTLRDLCREGADRNELFAEFLTVLESSPTTPVVVIEDLHWADAASAELLAHLTLRLQDAPVLVVASVRELELGRSDTVTDAVAAITRRPGTRRLLLGGVP
ncbi:MAG: ATP-binding protein, partial [Marmoricola sp.]